MGACVRACVLSLTMIVFHGANYLSLRTVDALQKRAKCVSKFSGLLAVALFVIGGIWAYLGVQGFVAVAGLDPAGEAIPLAKTVEVSVGAWFNNFRAYPVLWLVPVLGIVGPLLSMAMVNKKRPFGAFLMSSLSDRKSTRLNSSH